MALGPASGASGISPGVSVAAVVAGARAYTVIAEWAGDQPACALTALGFMGRVPSEATIRRVLSERCPWPLNGAKRINS